MTEREYFRICRRIRRFDRASGVFTVNIAYETAAPKPKSRVVGVAEALGLGLDNWEKFVVFCWGQRFTCSGGEVMVKFWSCVLLFVWLLECLGWMKAFYTCLFVFLVLLFGY